MWGLLYGQEKGISHRKKEKKTKNRSYSKYLCKNTIGHAPRDRNVWHLSIAREKKRALCVFFWFFSCSRNLILSAWHEKSIATQLETASSSSISHAQLGQTDGWTDGRVTSAKLWPNRVLGRFGLWIPTKRVWNTPNDKQRRRDTKVPLSSQVADRNIGRLRLGLRFVIGGESTEAGQNQRR